MFSFGSVSEQFLSIQTVCITIRYNIRARFQSTLRYWELISDLEFDSDYWRICTVSILKTRVVGVFDLEFRYKAWYIWILSFRATSRRGRPVLVPSTLCHRSLWYDQIQPRMDGLSKRSTAVALCLRGLRARSGGSLVSGDVLPAWRYSKAVYVYKIKSVAFLALGLPPGTSLNSADPHRYALLSDTGYICTRAPTTIRSLWCLLYLGFR
jgi:hypothetical protein